MFGRVEPTGMVVMGYKTLDILRYKILGVEILGVEFWRQLRDFEGRT